MAVKRIEKTDAEWRKELSPEVYRITRQDGTERAFTGDLLNVHEDGTFRCVCCGTPLFDAGTKYESGSGWPSFWEPIATDNVKLVEDVSHGMRRISVSCAACDAHLGHVFNDGPQPTGQRYCMNSASMKFDPKA